MANDPKLDSPAGIAMFLDWARAHRAVLNDRHKKLAEKYGEDCSGIIFAGKIPTGE